MKPPTKQMIMKKAVFYFIAFVAVMMAASALFGPVVGLVGGVSYLVGMGTVGVVNTYVE